MREGGLQNAEDNSELTVRRGQGGSQKLQKIWGHDT